MFIILNNFEKKCFYLCNGRTRAQLYVAGCLNYSNHLKRPNLSFNWLRACVYQLLRCSSKIILFKEIVQFESNNCRDDFTWHCMIWPLHLHFQVFSPYTLYSLWLLYISLAFTLLTIIVMTSVHFLLLSFNSFNS